MLLGGMCMKYIKGVFIIGLIIVFVFVLTSCKAVADTAVKKRIFDKYTDANGFACEVTVFDSRNNEITTAYAEIDGDNLSFEIKEPILIKGIKFLKKDGNFSVKYYDLSVDTSFIPKSIKPLITVLPAAFINKEIAICSVISSTETEYILTYTDPAKALTVTLSKDSYALTSTTISMENETFKLKFKDFIFMPPG